MEGQRYPSVTKSKNSGAEKKALCAPRCLIKIGSQGLHGEMAIAERSAMTNEKSYQSHSSVQKDTFTDLAGCPNTCMQTL